MKSYLFDTPERKKGTAWAKIRGAGCTGRNAKRIIHRRERHETRRQLREALASND